MIKAILFDVGDVLINPTTYIIRRAVREFKLDRKQLQVLVDNVLPQLQIGVPVNDHWGHRYRYERTSDSYSVTSLGRDGIDGLDIDHDTRLEFDRDIILSNGVFTASPLQ